MRGGPAVQLGRNHLRDRPGAPPDHESLDSWLPPRRLALRRPVRPAEVALAAVVVALVCAGYLALAWYDFDLLDEGYFLTHARRVELGGLPYRDFSTPYTPGIFYLYAAVLDHFGPNMVALRTPAVLGRGVEFLALYLAGRRLMPPFFAALPPALILAIDRAPPQWSIHPGWLATPASLLAVLALGRYVDGGRARWLVASCDASGVSFAFKQNLAAYGLMAALWFVVVAERYLPPVAAPPVGRRLLAGNRTERLLAITRVPVQVVALALLPLTAAVIVRPYWSPLVAALFVIPLAALSVAVVPLLRGQPDPWTGALQPRPLADGWLGRDVSFLARPLLLLAGFGAVTLPWLALLVKALDGRLDLLSGFVGNIDPSGYYYGMETPQPAHLALVGALLLAPLVVAALGRTGFWGYPAATLAVGTLGGLLIAGMAYPDAEPDPAAAVRWLLAAAGSWWSAFREASPHPTDDLVLWLPALAFWPALALLFAGAGWGRDRRATGKARPRFAVRRQRLLVRLWYLAAGAALVLGQYPRMGYGHIVWSGGMLFLVGADLLHCLARFLVVRVPRLGASPAGRAALCLSLAGWPAVAAFPYLQERIEGLAFIYQATTNPSALEPGERLVPLDLLETGNRIWAPADVVNPIKTTVIALRESTAPDEPIFAYPAIPGFYFLADRPNATRFNHLFAGMAAPADEEEMVRRLDRVRYMVWDDENVYHWVQPEDNAPVVEYIRTHFRESLVFGPYAFLSRDGSGPPRPKPTRQRAT